MKAAAEARPAKALLDELVLANKILLSRTSSTRSAISACGTIRIRRTDF